MFLVRPAALHDATASLPAGKRADFRPTLCPVGLTRYLTSPGAAAAALAAGGCPASSGPSPARSGHVRMGHDLAPPRLDLFERHTRLQALRERLLQRLLDPLAERHPGLVGCGRHRRAGRFVDAADRPAPGPTGASRLFRLYPHARGGPITQGNGPRVGPTGRGRAAQGIDQIFGSFLAPLQLSDINRKLAMTLRVVKRTKGSLPPSTCKLPGMSARCGT